MESNLDSIPWDCDFVRSKNGDVFRAYAGLGAKAANALLICNPLGEEAKSSFQVLSGFSGRLHRDGWVVARFDYRGTGDSDGNFSRSRPHNWLEDVACVIEDLSQFVEVDNLYLLGLRMGGNIASAFAASAPKSHIPAGLVLWEPILNPDKYIRHLTWVDRGFAIGEQVDHYGWIIERDCLDQIRQSLAIKPCEFRRPVFIVHVSGRKGFAKEFEAVRPFLCAKSKLMAIRARPFWELIGQTDCEPLILETIQWLNATRGRS